MGYDSNIKSSKAQTRQRTTLLFSFAGLLLAAFAVVSFLHKNDVPKASPPIQKIATDSSLKTQFNPANPNDVSQQQILPPQQIKHQLRANTEHNGDTKLESAAALHVAKLDEEVRALKRTGIIMETDPKALELTAKLQRATRELIKLRYGEITFDHNANFRVRMELEFQETIPDFEEKGKDGSVTIELAPIGLIPCSVYNFLEIARTWKSGAFHRNAAHVLQAMSHSDVTKSMPFQEYREEYPHKKGTVGYAGRPSGPEFYISIQDNTQNHGPGSQQKKNPYEADSIIGTVVEGMDDVVPRIHTMPGNEFIGDKNKWVLIKRMIILVPSDGPEADKDGYIELFRSPKD